MHPSRSASTCRMAPVALVVPFALLLVAGGLASCGSAASPPAKPAWLSAVPGDNTASLTWGAPQPHADVTSYVARAQPGGETCTTTGTSCTRASADAPPSRF